MATTEATTARRQLKIPMEPPRKRVPKENPHTTSIVCTTRTMVVTTFVCMTSMHATGIRHMVLQ